MIPLHDGQMQELVGVLRRRICHVLSTPSLPRVVEVACVAFQWTMQLRKEKNYWSRVTVFQYIQYYMIMQFFVLVNPAGVA